jgi:hypothetical protein
MLKQMLRFSARRAMSTAIPKARPRGRMAATALVVGAGAGAGYYVMKQPVLKAENAEEVDALIVGGGIMGATGTALA